MHNDSLTKPVLVLENTTLCTGCHDNIGYPVVTGAKEPHNGSVNCTECHLAVKQDIHGVKYLQQDGTNFTTSNASAVNCTTCHQGAGLFGAPTLGPLFHSNVNSGQRWDNYWTDNLTGCIYCHNDTKHISDALGNLDVLKSEPTDFTGMICSACHYNDPSSVYYNNVTQYLKPIPPEILNGTSWNGTSTDYFNHSLSDYTDASCKYCHQNTSSVPIDTPQMAHDVYNGDLTNCTLCHDIGSPGATTHIDISNLSMHRNANSSDGVNMISNLDCQECHNDTATMLPGQVPARNCTECHVDNVTLSMPANRIVSNHRPSANISTTVDCEACHKNSLIVYSPLSTTDSDASNISHYGTNTSLINTSNCVNCHMPTGINTTWGNAPPVSAHDRTGNCTSCHSSTGLQVIDFHNNSLEKPLANTCVKCHTNQTNVTKYNLPGLVQTHYPDAPANKANTTNISAYTCELCHNVSTATTGALHNSTFQRNNVNGVNGTCYECHSPAGLFTYKAAPVNHIDVLTHDNLSSALVVNCTSCHNVTGAGIFHYAQWPKGEVQQPSWAGWTNGSNVNCTGCHVAYNNSAPFYAPPPTHSPGYTLDACIQCHTQANNSTDPAYTVELHNVSGGDPTNCIGCHNEGNDPTGKTPPLNVSALEAGIHENLNSANTSNDTNLACYACHWTGTSPPVHPKKDVYTPKICEDCHGTTISFFLAPPVAEHRPGALDVETNSTNASCVVCHNNSVNTTVSSYANISDRVSHYGTTQNLLSGVLNKTQNCTYCHYTIANNTTWGSPMDPRVTIINFNHSVYTNNTDCYYCHAGNQTPANFHDDAVTGGAGKDCVSCHDIGGAAPTPKWLDVSAMNSRNDIHYDLNRVAIATTTLNPNNIRCWACHGDGDGTDAAQPTGHPANYNAPKNCNNNSCHAVSQSIFGEPMVYEHFRYVETIDEDIETTAGCDVCHKNSLQSHNDNDVKSDVALVSHYGSTQELINSSSCIYCHLDEDNGEKWGNAPDPTDNVTTLSETEREATLFMGEKWNIGNKYLIFFNDISIDGETAYVQLFHDDELINESFIHNGESYVFHDELTDIDGHEIKSIIVSVNVTAVFRGNEGTNLIMVKGRTLKRIHSEWVDESCYACHVDNYTSEQHRYLVIDKDDDNTYYTELLLDFEEDDIDQRVLTPRQESTIVISKGHNKSWVVNGYNFTARDVEIHDETAFINFEVNGQLMEENVYDVGERIEYKEDLIVNQHTVEDVVLFGADVEFVFHGFEADAVMLTNVRILSSLAELIDNDGKIGGYNVSWLQVNDTFFVGGAPENLHVPPLNDGVDGGPDCVLCHDVSANFGIATVDAISTQLGGHALLNENATNRTKLTDEIDKACWACHGDGTEPETHPADYLFPRECKSCHVQLVKPDFDAVSIADVPHGEVEDCSQCHSSRTEFHVINVFDATPQISVIEVTPQIVRSGDRVMVNFSAISGWKMYIRNMEYFIGEVGQSGTGIRVRPNDDVFDEQVEDGTFTIETTGWERGTYVIYVHAMERDNDWGPVQAVMFSIEPEQHMIPWWIVYTVLAFTGFAILLLWSGILEAPFIKGDITVLPPKVRRGQSVRIHATAVASPFRNIADAEIFLDRDGEPGTGTAIYPDMGHFGEKRVHLFGNINTTNIAPGIHTLHVRAMENSGKWGSLQTVTFEVEE
ncbi:MAG: cytochrome c3 family protein [ANME-2 cluster archaeon]|nr:cytochrome c3 family protein [ANME-2 cluster archaeon]